MKRMIRSAAMVGAIAILGTTGVVATAQPAQACNSVAQYRLTGENGTIRGPGGEVIGHWQRDAVINTWGPGGRQPGTTYGRVYTKDRRYIATGDVVSAYMTFERYFCA